jgi:hypothetical protein
VAALWLCQAGADVTALKEDGWKDTALHYAAARGHTEVCKVLLAFGAPVEAQNYAGLTPAQTAARSGHTRLSELLAGTAAGKTGFKFSPNNLPAPLRRKLATTVSQYQQDIANAATAAGAGAALAAAAGATAPLNAAGERSKPVSAAAVMTAAADAAARAAPAGSSAAAAAGGLEAKDVAAAAVAAAKKLATAAAQRGWEGAGSQGTELVQGTRVFRVLAIMSQVGCMCPGSGFSLNGKVNDVWGFWFKVGGAGKCAFRQRQLWQPRGVQEQQRSGAGRVQGVRGLSWCRARWCSGCWLSCLRYARLCCEVCVVYSNENWSWGG